MPNTISHFEGRYLSLREIDDWEFATKPNSTAAKLPEIVDSNGHV